MTRLGVAAAVLLSTACGKHGSNAPTQDWRVVGFAADDRHPAALLAAGRDLALVEPDARVRWKLTLADEAESHNADAVGDTILVTTGEGNGARLRALSAADGHELWSRTFKLPIKRLKRGGRSILIVRADETEVLDLATGVTRYLKSLSPEKLYFDRGRFVCATHSNLWAIDDLTGKELWSRVIPPEFAQVISLSNIAEVFFRPTTLVVHGAADHKYHQRADRGAYRDVLELDLTTGGEVSQGDIPTVPGNTVLVIGTTGDGNDYTVVERDGTYSIVARDATWQALWSVPAYKPTTGSAVLDSSGRVVIDLAGDERHLFFIDVRTGASAASARLLPTDRFADVSGTCALVFGGASVRCIDIMTGALRWTTTVTGDSVGVWALDNRDILIADGDPVSLSRLGGDGKQLWHTVVGGEAQASLYRDLVDVENSFLVADSPEQHVARWQSSTMAVVATEGRVRVLNLANGAVATPKL